MTCVSATIGRRGRSRATAEAVRPVNVGTRIAFAASASARSQAAFDIARPTVGASAAPGAGAGSRGSARPRARSAPSSRPRRPGTRRSRSRRRASPRRSRRGSRSRRPRPPRASAPGGAIIVSSICVAVIAGFPRSSAARMIRFWRSGTSAGPTSTPRSPRAIITASASSRISSSAETASLSSILAMTHACEPASSILARSAATSARERTNDCAT